VNHVGEDIARRCLGLRLRVDLGQVFRDAAFREGYDVLADTAFQIRLSYGRQSNLIGWPVEGMLIWTRPDDALLDDYLGGWTDDIPIVYLGYPRTDNADYVAIDRQVGVEQAMGHLCARGYKRIAYVYPWADLQPADARYGFYETFCRREGLTPERIDLAPRQPQDRLSPLTQSGLREAGLKAGIVLAAQPANDRPDAVLCHNDLVAIGFYHGLLRAGLSVPGDVAVVGFDGIDEGQFLEKPLTTVVSPSAEIVETAVGVLIARMSGTSPRDAGPTQILLPSALRAGETS